MSLSEQQIAAFEANGFLCPIEVVDLRTAHKMRREVEALETKAASRAEWRAALKNHSNWVLPWFDNLVRHPRIVGAVQSLLGPDLLALGVDLFIKEPRSANFVSWHQDLHYWGLDSDDEVTAWLALSASTPESGCMRFLPGSHRFAVGHRDTYGVDNMLSRGQELDIEADESKAVAAELMPGQMSLHHGRLAHASAPNTSSDRRIGVAMRFITPRMGLAKGGYRIGAALISGEDAYGHFELVERPTQNYSATALETWKRLREAEEKILFAEA